jgi:hypothetical protein
VNALLTEPGVARSNDEPEERRSSSTVTASRCRTADVYHVSVLLLPFKKIGRPVKRLIPRAAPGLTNFSPGHRKLLLVASTIFARLSVHRPCQKGL